MAREPLITAEPARRAGCQLVPIAHVDDGPLGERMARLGAEFGEAFSAYAAAIADGRVTPDEAARLARELQDVVSAAQRALATLSAELGA